MRNILFCFFLLIIPMSYATGGDTVTDKKKDGLIFFETSYDYGKIKKKDKIAYHDFKVKNSSDKIIVIQQVATGCNCVDTEYTQKPLRPGEEGVVTIIYKTINTGAFNKRITVFTSDGERHIINIKGEVVK